MELACKNFVNFTRELMSVSLNEYRNTNFRYEVLLLIRKFFGINMLSFLMNDNETDFNENYRDSLLDNVTLGLSKKSIEEYYNEYYMLNPLYNTIKTGNLENETKDFFVESNFETSDFYKKFYKKYGSFYLLSLGMEHEGRVIGILTYIKLKEEGDFTAQEKETLKIVRDMVGVEFAKIINYEKVKLENLTFKQSEKHFPVAKLVVSKQFNVLYNDKLAKEYIYDLMGSDPTSFKYFFINKLSAEGLVDTTKNKTTIAYKDYAIVVSKEYSMYDFEKGADYVYHIFVVKKPVVENRNTTKVSSLDDLTDREKEVAALVGDGLTNDEIADALVISPYTVKTHMQRIHSKLNVTSRVELIYYLLEHSNKST